MHYYRCIIIPSVDAKPTEELYAVFTNRVGKLIQTTAQPEGNFATPIPLTIDKRRRLIYYADDNEIRRVGLNSKAEIVKICTASIYFIFFNFQVLDNKGLGINISSLAYDWIGDILYITGTNNSKLVLLSVRLIDWSINIIYKSEDDVENLNHNTLTINPFTG